MKVGILTSFYPQMIGGAEASLEVLLRAYRNAGLEHVLFTLNRSLGRAPANVLSIPSFPRVPRQVMIGGFPILDEVLGRHLPKLIRDNGIDLLHVVDYYSLCGGVIGATEAGVPTIFTCQNDIGTPFEEFGVRFPLNHWLSTRERQVIGAMMKCSMTVAVSDFIARQLVEAGLPASKVRTVHVPGIMTEWPSNPTNGRHPTLRILGFGRLYRDKGFQVLLRAAAELRAERREFELRLAGRGPYARVLLRMARDLHLDEQLQFLGQVPRDRIASLIDWSDVVVVPTITPEPFPRAGVEAMSRGKPLIGSRVGGIPELISDNETGYLVAPNEPREIAQKLRALADRPDLLRGMGRRALDECRARFDSRVIVDQLTEIYRLVADRKAPAMADGVTPNNRSRSLS